MTVIANATIPFGKNDETRDVHIVMEGEAIREVLPAEARLPKHEKVLDATGLLVLPGAIDPHVHFNTPGYTEHEDFTHGSRGAAAGGVTCVIDMPDTSVPPVIDRASLRSKLKVVEDMAVIDFGLWGGVSGESFRLGTWRSNMRSLKHEGITGIKCYLLSGMKTFPHLLPLELIEVMRRAHDLGMVVALHAEDRERVQKLTASLMTAGRRDAEAYYESRRDPAELDGIKLGADMALETACKLHIVHVGSAAGAEYAMALKGTGLDLTMETCAHYLAFSHEDFAEFGAVLKTSPVVKTREDSAKLWKHLAGGDIDFLASDHAPCTIEEKNTGSIWTDYAGISGSELMFPFAFSEGYAKGRLTLERLVQVTSAAAAKRMGIFPRKGAIIAGTDADLVFVDKKRTWKVKGAELQSKGAFTPFEGREFTGKVVRTICRGQTVYEEGKGIVATPGYGQFIRRNS
jgi:allantoinase